MDYLDWTQLGRIRRGYDVGSADSVGHWGLQPVTTGASTQQFSPSTSLRDHLRIVTTGEDALLQEKLNVAQWRIERRTQRRCFVNQFDYAIERFPWDGSPLKLPVLPLVSVDSITYFDTNGNQFTFSSSQYFADTYSEPGRVCLVSGSMWPLGTRLRVGGVIRFTAGYSTTPSGGIPDPLVEAIRKLATELYENREASMMGHGLDQLIPYTIEDLIQEFLVVEVN